MRARDRHRHDAPRPAACWSCGHRFEAATHMTGGTSSLPPTPRAGDVTVCLYCGAVGLFTGEGIDQREPTAEERAACLEDPGVLEVLGAVLTRLAVDA